MNTAEFSRSPTDGQAHRRQDVVAYELEVLGPAADLLLVPKEQYKMLRRSLHATTGEGEVTASAWGTD